MLLPFFEPSYPILNRDRIEEMMCASKRKIGASTDRELAERVSARKKQQAREEKKVHNEVIKSPMPPLKTFPPFLCLLEEVWKWKLPICFRIPKVFPISVKAIPSQSLKKFCRQISCEAK